MDDHQDLHHQQQLDEQEQLQYCPAYCDYIAKRIKDAMNGPHPREHHHRGRFCEVGLRCQWRVCQYQEAPVRCRPQSQDLQNHHRGDVR